MTIKIRDRHYITLLCSDVDADGMYLEIREVTDEGEYAVADVFYSDQSHDMVFTTYSENIPLEPVEWLIQKAKADLPPRAWKDSGNTTASS